MLKPFVELTILIELRKALDKEIGEIVHTTTLTVGHVLQTLKRTLEDVHAECCCRAMIADIERGVGDFLARQYAVLESKDRNGGASLDHVVVLHEGHVGFRLNLKDSGEEVFVGTDRLFYMKHRGDLSPISLSRTMAADLAELRKAVLAS